MVEILKSLYYFTKNEFNSFMMLNKSFLHSLFKFNFILSGVGKFCKNLIPFNLVGSFYTFYSTSLKI